MDTTATRIPAAASSFGILVALARLGREDGVTGCGGSRGTTDSVVTSGAVTTAWSVTVMSADSALDYQLSRCRDVGENGLIELRWIEFVDGGQVVDAVDAGGQRELRGLLGHDRLAPFGISEP